MPRENAVGKWNLEKTPDEFYLDGDPFGSTKNHEEYIKCDLIHGLIEKNNILDIGCGEGFFTKWYAKTYLLEGIDISHIAIGRARKNCEHGKYNVHDITKSPLRNKYGCIIMSEVLYYIHPDLWKTTINNVYDMMTKGSQFIISVGQYFTESDIRRLFKNITFDKVFKIPSEKYEYCLVMNGHYVPNRKA